MTSKSQQTSSPGQANTVAASQAASTARIPPSSVLSASADTSGRSSYASATKKSFPPNVSEPSNMSTAVGGIPSAQLGQLDPASPVNGKNPTIPAVPSVGGPTIVNGNSTIAPIPPSDHSRKPSFTVSSSGATSFAANGGAVGGAQTKANNIQFGSMNAGGSPALGNPPALAAHSSSNLGLAPMNPRITSPQTSPSPIPQPAASGGRPPSSLQGQNNGLSFGQIGGDSNDQNVRTLRQFKFVAINFSSHSAQCDLFRKHSLDPDPRQFTCVEIPLNRHTARWEPKECRRVLEGVVIQCQQGEEEDTQGNTSLK